MRQCKHKTPDSHSARTHQYEAPRDCTTCNNTREVRTFKRGRATTKPCACMDNRPRIEFRIWNCTVCKLAQRWGPTWGYIGNVECQRCGWANIQAVFCSAKCAAELRRKPRFAKLPNLEV